jgi:hypothetical protein
MKLSSHDINQIDDAYIISLSQIDAHKLCRRLRDYLIEALDRLNQNSSNSSRPPSSQEPWFSSNAADEDEETEEEELLTKSESDDLAGDGEDDLKNEDTAPVDKSGKPPKREAGKQKGAQGYGRTQKLPVTKTIVHRPTECGGCTCKLGEEAEFVARTGHYVIDIKKDDNGCIGLQVTNTKHLYGDTLCDCGHTTRTMPHRCEKESDWDVELTEWHLVGPLLMALICCLAKRMKMSRRRIKEFLHDWLGIKLCVGTINQCIHEMGRAVAPVEEQLIEEVNKSGLLHADETSWKELGRPFWLWVFSTVTVTLYVVGKRDIKTIEKVLTKSFSGWLMTDGYKAYRWYEKRLRCWAHLERKAQGLKDSLNKKAQEFGKEALNVLKTLMKAIYRVRAGPKENLVLKYQKLLEQFRILCEQFRDADHEKTRALAREFLNDWEAIFRILAQPHLPLTNNEAERALRHWVILRRICFGTRTPQGTRVFALLASVIETCRKRDISPWDYLANVISERRRGYDAPPIPAAA